jgi:hypothetical protein
VLEIGNPPDAGAIGLELKLPYSGEIELEYAGATAGHEPPTLASIVSFLTAGWSLPEPVVEFGREIKIEKFTVKAGKVNQLIVALCATGKSWNLFPGDSRLVLEDVCLGMDVSSGQSSRGSIAGVMTIGKHGCIPLEVALQTGKKWNTFVIKLAEHGGPATLPTVSDLIGLIEPDWGGWAAALPSQVGEFGSGGEIKVFEFERADKSWSLDVELGTKATWSYKPIQGVRSPSIRRRSPSPGRRAAKATVKWSSRPRCWERRRRSPSEHRGRRCWRISQATTSTWGSWGNTWD